MPYISPATLSMLAKIAGSAAAATAGSMVIRDLYQYGKRVDRRYRNYLNRRIYRRGYY